MLKFRFAGNLRRHFRQIELNVETPAQGLRLLLAQCPDFKRDFFKTKLRVRMAGDDIHPDQIDFHMNRKLRDGSTILFAPVIEGSIGTSSPILSAITMGLLVGAYSSYMAGKVKTSAESDSESDSITNNSFTSADNRVGQGRPVPLLLGEMVVGSNVISLGIDTSNNADWEISIS